MEESLVDSLDKIKAQTVIPVRVRAKAATPPPAPAPVSTKISLSSDALFDFNKADIKAEGQAKLDALVARITGTQLDMVIATGHTDAIGSDEYNNRLSLARADAVKAYLVGKGVDVKRIRTIGKGKSEPVADNATPQGRARNRRVDIEVQGATK